MNYLDAQGNPQAVDLTVGMYREAAEAGQSLPQFLKTKYPTNAEKHGETFNQLLAQAGIFVRHNAAIGLRASVLGDILEPKTSAAAITKEGIPASRLLFPAAILSVIEDKLSTDLEMDPNAFESMLAVDESINSDRWERPVLNFSKPEAARSAPVAQLALPNSMLTITASDKSGRIPSTAIGLEISEQAMKSTTMDLVGLAMARQAAVERNERANNYMLSLLNGDSDLSMVALSSIPGKVVTAASLDAASTTVANFSHKAWITWLSKNSRKRVITHVITDLATAMAIEARVGRPSNVDNINGVNKINTTFTVANPRWPSNVQLFITDNPSWPASTVLGFDSRFGIHRIKSLTAQYSAIEQFAMRRSTQMRVDSGEVVYRLFDEAFEVLTLV